MKKQMILKIALLVMPLLVVLIAASPAGVTVFDGGQVVYQSWMQTVPESNLGWCAPVAALLNYILFALAIGYALFSKDFCLKGIYAISLAAACLAAFPIVSQGDLKIVPNAFGMIFLGIQTLLARMAMNVNAAQNEKKPKGKTLGNR